MIKKSLTVFSVILGIGIALYYHEGIEHAFAKLFFQQHEQQKIENNEIPLHENEVLVELDKEQIKQQGVKMETAAPGTLALTLSLRGKIILDPDRVAHVFPKIAGIATDPKKSVGNEVKEGEILTILESQEMANLKSAFLAALSKEKLAASILKREESLYEKKITAQQDYLNALNSFEGEEINLTLAKQKLQAFGLNEHEIEEIATEQNPNLRFIPLFSPISGTVLKKHLTRGEYVDNESLVYEIADLSKLLVEIVIYPKDLQRIKEGQKVEISNLENGTKADAKMVYISPLIEEETIAAKGYAQLENSQREWRPGSYVSAKIAVEQIDVPVAICPQAIQKIDGTDCAFIEHDKGFEKREVNIGRSDQENVEILSGIKPGERYVSENPFLIKAELKKDSAKDD